MLLIHHAHRFRGRTPLSVCSGGRFSCDSLSTAQSQPLSQSVAVKASSMRESLVCKRETKQERGTEVELIFLSPPGLILVKVPPCDYAVTSLGPLRL